MKNGREWGEKKLQKVRNRRGDGGKKGAELFLRMNKPLVVMPIGVYLGYSK